MDSLFTLQYTCLLVFAMIMLQLIVSRLYQTSTTPQYEKSRLLLIATAIVLITHYALQIKFKLRANDNNVGTVFNMLFYPIANYFMACSIIQIQSSRKVTRRYVIIGLLACLAIVGVFGTGWIVTDSMALGNFRHLMFGIFAISMIYFIVSPTIILRRTTHRINDETGGDISPYDRYVSSSYRMLCMLALSMIFAITWRPALFVVGPLILLALFLFVSSFVALGFNMASVKDVLDEDDANNTATDNISPRYHKRRPYNGISTTSRTNKRNTGTMGSRRRISRHISQHQQAGPTDTYITHTTEPILRPTARLYVPCMAVWHTLCRSTTANQGTPRIQQRHNIGILRFLIAQPAVQDIQRQHWHVTTRMARNAE